MPKSSIALWYCSMWLSLMVMFAPVLHLVVVSSHTHISVNWKFTLHLQQMLHSTCKWSHQHLKCELSSISPCLKWISQMEEEDRKDLVWVVETAQGIVGSPLPHLDSIYDGRWYSCRSYPPGTGTSKPTPTGWDTAFSPELWNHHPIISPHIHRLTHCTLPIRCNISMLLPLYSFYSIFIF